MKRLKRVKGEDEEVKKSMEVKRGDEAGKEIGGRKDYM